MELNGAGGANGGANGEVIDPAGLGEAYEDGIRARLRGVRRSSVPYAGPYRTAWYDGWDTGDDEEKG